MRKIVALFIPALLACCTNPLEKQAKTYQIKVVTMPGEAGIISPSSDSVYDEGQTIVFRATPTEDYVFANWSGDISSSENPYNLTVDKDYSLTANFVEKNYQLAVHTTGEGMVTERIVQSKLKNYEHGAVVELTAIPDDGYEFIQWQGALTSTQNPVRITIDRPKEVTAAFEVIDYELDVQVRGQGTVTQEIVKLKSENYSSGTQVELTAEPANGWQFIRWEGDISENDRESNTIVIQMNSDKKVTVVFYNKLEGVISGTATLTESEGPYQLTDEVRITRRTTLIMEPGVEVYGSDQAPGESNVIEVSGELLIQGSAGSEILLKNVVIKSGNNGEDDDSNEGNRIEMHHVHMIDGKLLPPTNSPAFGSITLKDSFLYEVNRGNDNDTYMDIRYPQEKCAIERNIFYNSGSMVTWLEEDDVDIKNNYFYRDEFLSEETGYAVENRADNDDSQTKVEGNTFANTQGVAVSFSPGFRNKRMDARKNYWSTTSEDIIERMIYDGNDTWRIFQEIPYRPYLKNPDPKTPVLPDSLR